jgi:hypothetical protein
MDQAQGDAVRAIQNLARVSLIDRSTAQAPPKSVVRQQSRKAVYVVRR